jgi:hypothetical protein
VAGNPSGGVVLREVTTGKVICHFREQPLPVPTVGPGQPITPGMPGALGMGYYDRRGNPVTLSPDRKWLAVVTQDGSAVQVWEVDKLPLGEPEAPAGAPPAVTMPSPRPG